ncbi:MAG: hypothetical protein NTX52_05400 [Planctomycetota bacterium]|nr:hypothetical protein [Planctomycetota bacterium]
MDINRVVNVFLKIRDEKARITREYEAAIAKLDEQQGRLNAVLLEECKTLNVESIRTEAGTAFKTVKQRYWVNDWSAVEKFIYDNDAFDLLERRLAQTAAKTWTKEYPDNPIPSLVVDSKYQITIRRGKP